MTLQSVPGSSVFDMRRDSPNDSVWRMVNFFLQVMRMANNSRTVGEIETTKH